MKYSLAIQKAIKFSIKTHDVYQKQKRKGKDISYITHPMSVGIILSLIGASENVIVAGILHDTIEDSVPEKKVDGKMIEERFGKEVSELVLSVTESDKSLSWEERKKEVRENILKFSNDSLLVKSADIISNNTELIDDYLRYGDQVFDRFGGPKEKIINHNILMIESIIEIWKENPLKNDLEIVEFELKKINWPEKS